MNFKLIDDLLGDQQITEIMINGWDKIFVEINGIIIPTAKKFDNPKSLFDFIFYLLAEDKKAVGKNLCYEGVFKGAFRFNILTRPKVI